MNSSESYDLSLFFELSPDLLCIAGYDGYFRHVNHTVCRVLGYSYEELMAQPIDSFIHPEDRQLTSRYRDNLRQGIPLMNYENRYLTRDGDVVWLTWTSIPIPDKKQIYAIAKQVSHKKRLEADRNQLLTQLTRINTELKQLTYTTSHDLRAPVNNLIAIFSLLDPARIPDPETRQYIELLRFSTEVLQQNLNRQVDLLSHQDQLDTRLEPVSPGEVLTEVMLSLQHLIDQARARFEVDFTACGQIRFNRAYLESVLLNLISNAIKYASPERSPVIHIRTLCSDGESQLIFSDNGLGFDLPNMKDRLFGLRQTFHGHCDSKGIGLYLVHNHVTSLGGRIEVESALGQGTTFTLRFPD